ncbi:MAG: M20/M25/M40 family metallo-hydrolase [Acidobacteria bacterium]|nr:M20/M25/M40 family metallo-hydrolase [Acidobacteriota bacterium]
MQELRSLHPWADWLVRLCELDSSTGFESRLVPVLWERLTQMGAHLEIQQLNENQVNIFAQWGEPGLLFSTHLDTVPPFIAPHWDTLAIYGRGACDAKGQIVAQLAAIQNLLDRGVNNVAWLGLAGEETDSLGAQSALTWSFLAQPWRAIINGEPTQNRMATGQRGVYHVALAVQGKAAHSGTPEKGENALFPLIDWIQALRETQPVHDPLLGPELWNCGHFQAANPANIIAGHARSEVWVRTVPQGRIPTEIKQACPHAGRIDVIQELEPFYFQTRPGFEQAVVPFGSDAPTLAQLAPQAWVFQLGPGSIEVAHGPDEHLCWSDLHQGIELLTQLAIQVLAESEICEVSYAR